MNSWPSRCHLSIAWNARRRETWDLGPCLVAARCKLGSSIGSSETVAVTDEEEIGVGGIPTVSIRQFIQPFFQKPPFWFLLHEGQRTLVRGTGIGFPIEAPAEISPCGMGQMILG